jgi:hypothetical protein
MNDSKASNSPDGVVSLSKSLETLSIAAIPNATVGVSQKGTRIKELKKTCIKPSSAQDTTSDASLLK